MSLKSRAKGKHLIIKLPWERLNYSVYFESVHYRTGVLTFDVNLILELNEKKSFDNKPSDLYYKL